MRQSTIGALARDTGSKAQTIRYYEAIGLLPERTQRVVALYFGGETNNEAIALKLNLTANRVSQIRLAAIKRLRRELARLGMKRAA